MARNSLKNVCRLIDVTKANIEPEQSFLNDLKRSIEMTEEKNQKIPSCTYKPSSMQCVRNMWYQVTGKEPDPANASYVLTGICNAGTDIHERVQQAVIDMKSNNMDCEYINVADFVRSRNLDYLEIKKEPNLAEGEYETKLYHKDLNISFLCDGIIRYKDHYYILELKTETSRKWWDRKGVDPKHYNQGTAYSLAFNIDEVIFVYISRDNLDMKSFMFNVTDDMKQELVGKIEECDGYKNRLICPPKPEDLPKNVCEYCNYKQSCRKEN